MRPVHLICILSLVALWWIPSKSAHARGCTGDWDYSVKSLQEARRRIKSPAHKTRASRVDCGEDILVGLATSTWPQTHCEGCTKEYIQLLNDVILFTRSAAEGFSVEATRLNYYDREIELRKKLSDFLVATKDPELIDQLWSTNFEGMSDAMERSYKGKELHREVLRNRGRFINEKTFETWARAIRSCETWDFRKGRNRDLPGLKRALLCADECRMALVKIRERSKSAQDIDNDTMSDVLDTLLPALDQCPLGAQP